MKKRVPSILNMGITSILVIFILLSLAVFATLSLVTAYSDYQLSQKNADRVTAYYNAKNEGEAFLAQADELLIRQHEAGVTSAKSISHSIEFAEDVQLNIELKTTPPEKAGDTYYTITKWTVENTREWVGDTSLNLFDGNFSAED